VENETKTQKELDPNELAVASRVFQQGKKQTGC